MREALVELTDPIEIVGALTATPMSYYKDLWPHHDVVTKGASTGNTKRTPFTFHVRYAGGGKNTLELRGEGGVKRQISYWSAKGSTEHSYDELTRRHNYYCIRHRKADVAKDLPEKTRQVIRIDAPDGEIAREMRIVERRERGATRVHQLMLSTARIKIPHVVEGVMQDMAQGQKSIVYSFNPETAHLLTAALKKAFESRDHKKMVEHQRAKLVAAVDVSTDDRHELMRAFRDWNGAAVYNTTIKAAQMGSLRGAMNEHWIDRSDDPIEDVQAEERPNEVGTRGIHILDYVVERTIDQTKMRKLMPRLEAVARALADQAAAGIAAGIAGETTKPLDAEEILAELLEDWKNAGASFAPIDTDDDPEWKD